MKTAAIAGLTLFFLTSCSQIKLEKEEAAAVIRTIGNYPGVYEYDVNMSDPASARKLLEAGLEKEGWVTVDKTQKLKDAGKPIVHFTEKARPYLIRIDEKYKHTQVVKLADMDLEEITGIQLQKEDKSAVVEYTIAYKNITPFAKFIEGDLSKKKTRRINLAYFDTGWKLDKKLW